MILENVLLAIIPLSGVIGGLWFAVRKQQQDSITSQMDRLMQQVEDLQRSGQETDARIDVLSDKLQKSREDYLECLEKNNELRNQLRQIRKGPVMGEEE